MLEQVESKIQELKQLQTEEYYKKKDADLQAWGLTYRTDGNKVTPIIVTDEEYEALIKASNGVDRIGRNTYAKALNILAFIAAGAGCLAGSIVAAVSDELPFVYFTLCIVAGLIVGVIFKGMSEIIKLLQQIIDSKPNEKPEGLVQQKPQVQKAAAPKSAQSQQAPVYPQVQIQAQPQGVQVQPMFTQVPGSNVYTQQPPVYVYQQPVQVQPQQTQPASGFSYGQNK